MDILIVDDDTDLATTLGEVLEASGHTVRVAFDGAQGLAAMDERLPDLILLDVEMPILDGPGMAYRILARDAGRELVPIVVSSGYAEIDAVAARIGTPYNLRKPCSLDVLNATIERAFREKRAPCPPPQFRPPEPRP